MVSLDGNFGLCRKKAAESSIYGPLSETAMFLEQSKVGHFISHYPYQHSKSIVVSLIKIIIYNYNYNYT